MFELNGNIQSWITSTGPLRIGGNSVWPNEFFSGLIDEVRALSSVMGRTARNAVGYKEILEAL